jgi:hypothetical protein
MKDEKIIGVEQEAKVYAIGPYRLTVIPITELNLPAAKKVLAGFASMRQFEDETLIGAFTKVYSKFMRPVLRAEGTTPLTKLLIALRIQTPFRILSSRATLGEVGEIIQDFFVHNFSSNQQSGHSSGNILLNLIRPASPPTSMTSSIT